MSHYAGNKINSLPITKYQYLPTIIHRPGTVRYDSLDADQWHASALSIYPDLSSLIREKVPDARHITESPIISTST